MENFINLINDSCFPIACVAVLGWYANKTTDKLFTLTEKVTNALTETSNKMKELTDTIKELLKEKEI